MNTLSVSSLRDKLTQEDKRQSFTKYGESFVKDLREANRIGTARSYNYVISVLSTYKGKDISFTEINYLFLTKFKTHPMSKGNDINGLAVYMRTIRAIFNKASKAGVVEKEIYPFTDCKIKTAPTQKRALDANLLSNIFLQKPPKPFDIFIVHLQYVKCNFDFFSHEKFSDFYNTPVSSRFSLVTEEL